MMNQTRRPDRTKKGQILIVDRFQPFRCPYLGLRHDAETARAYPDAANCCHRHGQPTTVAYRTQETLCLTDKYASCSIFQEATFQEAEESRPSRRLLLSRFAAVIVVVLLLVSALVWWPQPGSTIREGSVFSAPIDKYLTSFTTVEPVNASPESREVPGRVEAEGGSGLEGTTAAGTATITPPEVADEELAPSFRVVQYDQP